MTYYNPAIIYYKKPACIYFFLIIISIINLSGCSEKKKVTDDSEKLTTGKKSNHKIKKKILFVNSYHKGYQWSDGIEEGLLKTLGIRMDKDDKLDNSKSKVALKIFRMDTKRNKSEKFKKNTAFKAKTLIELWKPDIVITSDDIAAKYLILPYFKNSRLPFVFCGVNLDAKQYGFPVKNITGMIEVNLISPILDQLKKYAKGNRIGLLGADSLTRRKSAIIYRTHYKLNIDNRFAGSFNEWKNEFLKLQNDVDMMIITSPAGISKWNRKAAVQFVLNKAEIPSGCMIQTAMPFALIGYIKVPREQGEWAAKTALEILHGKSPGDIPVAKNIKAKIHLNMRLAKKLNIVFPIELIEKATIVKHGSD